jgi:energy-coupling factor transport system ATP-binding protein
MVGGIHLIEVRELRCRYPGQTRDSLKGVTFDLPSGTLSLLSGSTGSGKTTLGLLLCGVIPHLLRGQTGGRVRIDGKSPEALTVAQLSRTAGFLMQNVELQVFTDRVEDEVAFGLENFAFPAHEMAGRIHEALGRVRAGELLGRSIASLSSGERQRVMLAALLCLNQPVLILDEPLAFLDRRGCWLLLALIRGLALEGRTVLIFEHRRDLVLPMAHREICLADGLLVDRPPECPRFRGVGRSFPGGEALLELEGVRFNRKGAPRLILDRVSLEIARGESVVLLGENGAGKTTLMKLIVGLLKPQEGRITVRGSSRSGRPPGTSSPRTAYVFQNPDHQLHLPSVRDQIAWQTADEERARQEVESMGLRGLEDRHPHSLSMGQKRRVTLAAALSARPDLLLLDEPSVGQDDGSLGLILRRMDRFVAEGGALLSATHDARAARALGQRAFLLRDGGGLAGGPDLIDHFFEDEPATEISS